MTVSIIVGMGEVGKALREVLQSAHETHGWDTKGDRETGRDINQLAYCLEPHPFKVLHICFGYSDGFVEAVKDYQALFMPKYTIVHSTTPVGVCRALGVYHSPVRGIHPHLAESMRIFTTYLAPRNPELEHYLKAAGFKVQCVSDSDETEAGKLWCLAAYAWSIMLEKEIYRYCQEKGLDFKVVYTHFTHTYNDGYGDMGMFKFQRPVLEHIDGKVGGHCVIPGTEKLSGDSFLADLILRMNEAW